MSSREYAVTQWVNVSLDESKFTDEFMAEFREQFYDFHTVEGHAEYLARLYANGSIGDSQDFIEGYGDPADFGIRCWLVDLEVEKC